MTNLTVYKGLDWERTLTVTTEADGTAKDITGAAIEFRLARHSGDAPAVTLTVGSGITITDGPGGIATIAIAGATSDALDAGNYVACVRVTPAGESVPQVVIDRVKIGVRSHP